VAGGGAGLFAGARAAGPQATAAVRMAATARDADLVPVPGGKVRIGDDAAPSDERPAFDYRAAPLLMDRTPVTVAQFRAFVAETGYVTDAERFGAAGVLDKAQGAWALRKGATWRRPLGPDGPAAESDHPVTQVSWRDADAFCRAYGARLPTEMEWERAARLGQTPDGHVFRMGDPIRRGAHFAANVWQGLFPLQDTGEDGYRSTSPVGAFGAAPSGLTDMAGNVWEWTASWYVPYGARGPIAGQGNGERVQRGGSFLCDPSVCDGFRATARSHSTPDTSLMHVGFRCVVEPGRFTPLAGRPVSVDVARAKTTRT
jgi:sulfatase modifying factor 1